MTLTNRRAAARGLCVAVTLVGTVPSIATAQTEPTEAAGAQPAATSIETPLTTLPTATTVTGAPAATAIATAPKWYDVINVGAFVDAYYNQNWNGSRPNVAGTCGLTCANAFHPYTSNTGFNLAWVGLDASIDPAPVGATLQLRFGPSVPNLALGDFQLPGGIGFVQQGYASWKPQGKEGKLTLILGKFDTIYGAEVAQSHLNMNYTRGFLYNLAQPFFHTGLRADIAVSDLINVKLLAVNGWNNTIDNNATKSLGGQVTITPADQLAVSVGYMGGAEEPEVVSIAATPSNAASTATNIGANGRVRHLVDVIADIKPTKDFRVVANGDYVTQAVQNSTGPQDNTQSWYGAALLARYQITEMFAAAIRGEYIKDKDGAITTLGVDTSLVTGTLTLEVAPHKMLLIRLDSRIDSADQEAFKTLNGAAKSQLTTTLGVVAHTN